MSMPTRNGWDRSVGRPYLYADHVRGCIVISEGLGDANGPADRSYRREVLLNEIELRDKSRVKLALQRMLDFGRVPAEFRGA